MRRKPRHPAQRLRTAVDAMPRRTRVAMLRGIDENEIIAGGYADKRLGGICPMLAAHRNGGRTSLASFARAWDRFTGARRPRLATSRELRALRSHIEMSLLREQQGDAPLASLARRIERERAARRPRRTIGTERSTRRAETGERHRGPQLRRRRRWAWLVPARRYGVFADRLTAAQEQASEQRASELLMRPRRPAGSRPSG
jgi:hypothetical protein